MLELNCKICRKVIADPESAVHFRMRNATQFVVHPECKGAVTDAGVIIGNAVRDLVEIRHPGLFSKPLIRSVFAAIQELRK